MFELAFLVGEKVLVRCQAGWNRSGLATTLALMNYGYTAKGVIDLIRDRRSPHELCNKDFVRYLGALDKFPIYNMAN